MNKWFVTAAWVIMLAAGGGSGRAGVVLHSEIVASGTSAPAGGTYASFSNVHLNSTGQVAYVAGLTGGSSPSGVFRSDGMTDVPIALLGGPSPVGGNYAFISVPLLNALNSSGQVAYAASVAGGSNPGGIFRHDGATAVAVAQYGEAPAGGSYAIIELPQLNSAGQVAYRADLGGGSSASGIFRHDGATGVAIALEGTAAPGGGNYASFGELPQLNSSGQVAYGASLTGGSSSSGIFRHDGATGVAIALQGSAVPGGGIYDSFWESPQLNASGQVAYVGNLADSTSGIFRHDGTTGVSIARQFSPSPAGGIYLDFVFIPQLSSNGHVAFVANLALGSSSRGIFRSDGATTDAIALIGMSAPGTTGTFSSLGPPPINDAGLVVFRGTLTIGVGGVTAANDTGFWYGTDQSNVSLLVREGATLFVNGMDRTLAQLPGGYSLTELGVAWTASFTDGTSAVIYSTFSAVPEARQWVMLGLPALAAMALSVQQRRRRMTPVASSESRR